MLEQIPFIGLTGMVSIIARINEKVPAKSMRKVRPARTETEGRKKPTRIGDHRGSDHRGTKALGHPTTSPGGDTADHLGAVPRTLSPGDICGMAVPTS